MEPNKNLEYYLDSNIYTGEDVKQSIEKTKKEFPNKNVKVRIALNEYGMYIITFQFENKKTWFNQIIIKIWTKFRKKLLLENGERKDKYERANCKN